MRFLARVVVTDGGSVTSENIRYVKSVSGLSPLKYGWARFRSALPSQAVPQEQMWRLGLLSSLLSLRKEKYRSQEDTNRVESMIVSLCTT